MELSSHANAKEKELANSAGWEDVKGGTSKFDKLDIAVGENRIRILEEKPYFHHEHWIELPTGVRKLICSGEGCLICRKGVNASKRYFLPVWDYKTKSVKILEGGIQIFNGLKNYHRDPEYGNLTMYDVKICREGTGLETKYSIVPSPNKSAPTKEMTEALEQLGDVAEYSVETSVEDQQMFIAQMEGKVASTAAAAAVKGADPGDDFFKQ